MSNKINQLLTILQLLIASGTFTLIYFANEKMGVSRHLSYMNQKVEAVFQFENLSIILGVTLMISSVVFLVKQIKTKKLLLLDNLVLLLYSILTAGFILRNDAGSEVYYYYVGLLLLLFIGIQIAKVFLSENSTLENNSLKKRVFNVMFLVLCFLIFLK